MFAPSEKVTSTVWTPTSRTAAGRYAKASAYVPEHRKDLYYKHSFARHAGLWARSLSITFCQGTANEDRTPTPMVEITDDQPQARSIGPSCHLSPGVQHQLLLAPVPVRRYRQLRKMNGQIPGAQFGPHEPGLRVVSIGLICQVHASKPGWLRAVVLD